METFIKALCIYLISLGACTACGYKDCPSVSDSLINLHIVPHSHDDVGWIETVDQYYYGGRDNIQSTSVKTILDSVVHELMKDSKRRFIYVETAFFWKWWSEQSDFMKREVKVLVNNGQLEFIGGAWSMNDEATTHYQSIIDQFTLGLRRLKEAFGDCGRPKIVWQIDPFGHSRENAGIMARIGFDGLFLGRIDWEDKLYRLNTQTMEMLWSTSANDKTEAASLFTGVLYNGYSSPENFCFDINCADESIIDNPLSPEYNINRKVGKFLEKMDEYAKSYKTKNVLVTMGDDFQYMKADMNYNNMDKLIMHINKLSGPKSPFKAFYSTPSCYLKAVHSSGITLPVKNDDFFPYSSDPNVFWTGYYSSRPTLKRFERMGNNYLQVSKQLIVLSNLGYLLSLRSDLNAFKEAMSIMQHHDAVSGTEKQHVADDYAKILTNGIISGETIAYHALGKISSSSDKFTPLFRTCLLLNVSSCDVSEHENKFVVTIYNPLSRPVSKPIRIPIKNINEFYSVKCPMGKEQITQYIRISPEVLAIPGRPGGASAELVFIAENLPPLGFRSYYVSKVKGKRAHASKIVKPLHGPIDIGFENSVRLTLTPTGILNSITTKDGIKTFFSYSLRYYISAYDDIEDHGSSGAYIFKPNSSSIEINSMPDTIVIKGPVLNEVHIRYSDWASQIIRVYLGSSDVEFQWLVGPIPIKNNEGKEIIAVYKSLNLHNNGSFFTDSNGREALLRKLNYRETWPVSLSEPISSNYYPVTTRIYIEDEERSLHVITDRSQGGSSLNDGEIELMVHRRLLHDDGFGVDEALNETAYGSGLVAIGSHIISFENNGHARKVVQEQVLSPWIFFSPAGTYEFKDWKSTFKMEFSGLQNALPDNVQILTLEPWTEDEILLRLEHICEKNDDFYMSKSVEINLKTIFSELKIVEFKETLLAANYYIDELNRLKWNINESKSVHSENVYSNTDKIVLKPMEIRSFIIKIATPKI